MHRLIMSSSTYRMSSTSDPRCLERDPGNDLMWRFEMRRLGAEELRDSVIAVTGKLNRRLGGRSFFSAIPKAALATSSRPNAVWGRSSEEDMRRRSVYIKVKRSLATPLLSSFDVADTDQSCPVRFITTHPGQSLSMMNGNFLNKQAGIFAKRLQADAPGNPAAQIRLAHKLCFGRVASGDEVRDHLAFMQELQEDFGLDQGQSLEQLCLLVLNLNEFVYLD